MGVLYITEPGAVVGRKRERLQVRKHGALLANPRADDTEVAVLTDAVHLSPRATLALVAGGADIMFITPGGEFDGRVGTSAARRFGLRHAQRRALADPAFTLDLARCLVSGQIRNQRALLMEEPGEGRTEATARSLLRMRLSLERLEAADDVAAVCALGEQAEEAYRIALGERIRAAGIPPVAIREGAAHPVDVLRALAGTLLGRWVQGLIEKAGLDASRGVGLSATGRCPALAADLLAELSPPIVDAVVVTVLNRGSIRIGDFTAGEPSASPVEDAWPSAAADRPPSAPRIGREAAKRFLVAYERKLLETAWYTPAARNLTRRRIVQEQVYRLARHFRGEAEYEPDAPPF